MITLGKRAQTKKGGPRRRRPVIVHASAPMPWSPFENAPLCPLRCRFGNRPSAISQTDLSGVGRFLFLGLVVDRGGLAQDIEDLLLRGRQIGRASCRERVCQYV